MTWFDTLNVGSGVVEALKWLLLNTSLKVNFRAGSSKAEK